MGTDTTPAQLRGFLVPFAGFGVDNFLSEASEVTQGEALAGVPEPQQSSSLVLQSRGPQSQGVDIKTHEAGNVGIHNASFVWKYQADANNYGWEPPNKICNIEQISTGLPLATTKYIPRDAKKLPTGVSLVAVEYTTLTNNEIRIYKFELDGSFSDVTVDTVTVASLNSQSRFPTLCILPDGTAVCFAWEVDSGADRAYIKSWRSDDGVGWNEQSYNVLPFGDFVDLASVPAPGASGFDLGRLTAASDANSLLLFAEVIAHNTSNIRNKYIQYFSAAQGTKFTKIEESDSGPAFYFKDPDIVVFNGVFVISYGSSPDTISIIRLANASTPISVLLAIASPSTLTLNTAYNIASNEITGGGKTMFIDDSGRIHLYVLEKDYDFLTYAYSDVTGIGTGAYGENWNLMRQAAGTLLTNSKVLENQTAGGASQTIKNIVGVSGQGENLVWCNEDDNGGTNAYQWALQLVFFGGWRSIQYPPLFRISPTDKDYGYNFEEWIPTSLPTANAMWAQNTAAAFTTNLRGDRLELTTDATGYIYYSQATVTDKSNGVFLHFKVKDIDSGTVTRSTGVSIKVQQPSTTQTYHVEIAILSTSLYIYDMHGSGYVTPLASDADTSGLNNDFVFFVWLDNSDGTLRVLYGNSGSPIQWRELSGTLTLNANTTQHIHWGILYAAGSGTQESNWGFFSVGQGTGNGVGLTGFSPLNGRRYAPNGFWTDIKDGLQISTLDGPARENELWLLRTQYLSGVNNLIYEAIPSVSNGWRSDSITNPDTADVPQERLAWCLDNSLRDDYNCVTNTSALGVHLENINFREFTIDTYNATTMTWTTIATVDNTVAGGFSFTRVGQTIFSTEADGEWFHYGEAIGWYILLDDGAGTELVRKIKYNGEGVNKSTGTKVTKFWIEDAQASDPVSGTAYIIPSSCTVIYQANVLAAVRITIPAQRTKEGYFQIGKVVIGELVVPARTYSLGRSIMFDADVVSEIQENGVQISTKTGRGGRNVRISWSEGVDTSVLFDDPSDPNFWKLQTTGSEIAAVGSAPTTMIGLVKRLAGAVTPLVYLPSIDTGAGASIVLNRYYETMMCNMSNDVEIQNVTGEELQGTDTSDIDWGEVLRIGSISLREIR